MPHIDYHVQLIPYPVIMRYIYFWFWLIMNVTFEVFYLTWKGDRIPLPIYFSVQFKHMVQGLLFILAAEGRSYKYLGACFLPYSDGAYRIPRPLYFSVQFKHMVQGLHSVLAAEEDSTSV